jgi:hypothetical protein
MIPVIRHEKEGNPELELEVEVEVEVEIEEETYNISDDVPFK